MKKIIFMMILNLAVSWAMESAGEHPMHKIAVMDVRSTTIESGKTQMLTEILRTELFRIHKFKIMERGVIQQVLEEQKIVLSAASDDKNIVKIGKLLAVDRLCICHTEFFDSSLTLNVRIIDVQTLVVDYAENVFVKQETEILNAIREMVKKIDMYYSVQYEMNSGNSENKEELQARKWKILGADEQQTAELMKFSADADDYLGLRQYDISFSVAEFLEIIKNGWSAEILKGFFSEGIPYSKARRALSLGITTLKQYIESFQRYRLTFDDYLDAYQNSILDPVVYKKYKNGYTKDRFIAGLGIAADNIPLGNAAYKVFILNIGWEHFLTDFQRGQTKRSTETGLFAMINKSFAPVPYIQANWYIGKYPYYFKTSGGLLLELLVGGHVAAYVRPGIEIKEHFEWTLFYAIGNAPVKKYSNSVSANTGKYLFSYWAFMLNAKF